MHKKFVDSFHLDIPEYRSSQGIPSFLLGPSEAFPPRAPQINERSRNICWPKVPTKVKLDLHCKGTIEQ